MSSKRLLKKASLVALLLLIPLMMPVVNSLMEEDSGVLKIVLSAESNDEKAQKIIDSLVKKDSIINFELEESPEKAIKAVEERDADSAWIFSENFSIKCDLYGKNKTADPLVTVYEGEDTVPLKLSKEILYGALFSDISYSIHKNFVYSDVVDKELVSENKIEENYNKMERNGEIVVFERLNSEKNEINTNYLIAPLRGMMSLIVVLCALVSAMYFLKDSEEGKYDWIPKRKRLAPAFSLCLSASLFSGIVVFLALNFSSFGTGVLKELVSMVLFVFMSSGFALMFCLLFKNSGKLGATLPGIMIIMLVLSPIFFNVKALRIVRLLLPTYYYLQATYNSNYYLYSVVYCIVVYGTVLLVNSLIHRRGKGSRYD